ncbi:hypothetical protein TorRG33x02_229060, partial [Trema orientale]
MWILDIRLNPPFGLGFDLCVKIFVKNPSLIGDFLTDSGWSLPSAFTDLFSGIADVIKSVVILDGLDALYWLGSLDGRVTYSDAYASLSDSPVVCSWGKQNWSSFIPPSSSVLLWRILHDQLPTLWSALSSLFRTLVFLECSARDLWDRARLCSFSPQLRAFWKVGLVSVFWIIWRLRNLLRVKGRPRKAPIIVEVIWRPPLLSWVKVNTDGSAYGSPGPSGCS